MIQDILHLMPPPTLGIVPIAGALISAGLSFAAGLLLTKRSKGQFSPDDTPTTISTRGTPIPLIFGRRRVGPVFGWAGFRNVDTGSGGGNDTNFGGGGGAESTTYTEGGWHQICIGPALRIHNIFANGKRIWGTNIDSVGSPSGTTLTSSVAGDFDIYWGERTQPISQYLRRNDRAVIDSRWPWLCYVLWRSYILGASPSWPQIEYDIEVRSPIAVGLSRSSYWLNDGTSSGVNPAHALYQVLHAPYPHGLGIGLEFIDIDSLEQIGELMEEEHLPMNAVATDAVSAAEFIGAMLLDMGVSMPQVGSALKFKPIRAVTAIPAPTDPEEEIDEFAGEVAVLGPDELAGGASGVEVEVNHSRAKRTGRVTFSFPNEQRRYREFDIKLDNDAAVDEQSAYNDQSVPLMIPTHIQPASVVARRRSQEEFGDKAKISFTAVRGGRLLYPGDLVDVDGVGRVRITERQVVPDSPEVKLTGLIDSYAISTIDDEADGGTDEPEALSPEQDQQFTFFEVPAEFAGNRPAIIVFRVHAHEQITGAAIWGSIDSGVTYNRIGNQDVPSAGGILLESMSSGTSDIESGPIFEAQDERMAAVLDLSVDTGAWEAGQQLLVIGDECMFLRNVTMQSEGTWGITTAYAEGAAVVPTLSTGLRYVCTTAGTSGTTEPTWPLRKGETVVDGTCVWEARHFRYQLEGIKRAKYGTSDASHAPDDWLYIVEADRLTRISHSIITPGVSLCIKTQPRVGNAAVSLSAVAAVCKTIASS